MPSETDMSGLVALPNTGTYQEWVKASRITGVMASSEEVAGVEKWYVEVSFREEDGTIEKASGLFVESKDACFASAAAIVEAINRAMNK